MLKRIFHLVIYAAISACVFAGYRATIAEVHELSQSEIGVVAAADDWSWGGVKAATSKMADHDVLACSGASTLAWTAGACPTGAGGQ